MNRPGWILSVACIAVGVSVAMTLLLGHRHGHRHTADSEEELHGWMHANLSLTKEQDAVLLPLEQAYELRRLELHSQIEQAGYQLSEALRKGDLRAQETEDALARLDRLQAELRRVTLEHFFAMKNHLDPGQSERLLQWVAESISPHGHRD